MIFKAIAIVAILLIVGCSAYIILDDDDDIAVDASSPFTTLVCTPEYSGTIEISSFSFPTVTYAAVPSIGYSLSCWQDDGGNVLSTEATITIDITETSILKAVFVDSSNSNVIMTWSCPISFDTTVTTVSESFFISISSDDYSQSMAQSTVHRHQTTLVPTPAYMVSPEDQYVQAVADYLTGITEGYTELEIATAILYFVQTAIPYELDSDLYGISEYWAFPIECLYNHAGDCEDTAILFCSIAEAMGFDTALVGFNDHMGAAIVVSGVTNGQTYTDTSSGMTYTYCETATDEARGIGLISDTYRNADYTLVPIITEETP